MPERVVMVEPGGRGGVAQNTWCLCRALARSGVDVVLVTAVDYEWANDPPVQNVVRVLNGRRTNPWRLGSAIRGLCARGYRTWHLQSASHPGYLAALVPVLRLAGARRILVTAHNAVPHNSGRWGRRVARTLYRRADALFAHGPTMSAVVAELAGLPVDDVVSIPLGNFEELPLPERSRIERDEVLFFGYIHPAKGLDVLIRAAGILRRRGVPFRLHIAGRAEEPWQPYRDLLTREWLGDTLTDLGYVDSDRVAHLFSRAAVLVLPYRAGSQSGVPQLAARYMTPVVATRVGGMEDHLTHGQCALIVEPENPQDLAAAIERVLSDREFAGRLARNLKDRYHTESSVDEIVRLTLPVYRGAVDESTTPAKRPPADTAPAAGAAPLPFVTVIVPVRNEAAHIDACLDAVLAQTYPSDRMEVLVADGRSEDDTRERVRRRAGGASHVRLIDNPEGIVPTGMNAALAHARGEVIARVDGHTRIAPDYLTEAIALLERRGAAGVGGPMRAEGDSAFGRAVAAATSSPFGVGDSRFHYADAECETDSVYMGVYRARVLRDVGGYDPELVRNQDDELNARIRTAGGRLIVSPRLRSSYTCRGSARALWRQYFQYGSWKVRSLHKSPAGFRPRHAIPVLFCAGLLFGPALALWWAPAAGVSAAVLAAYAALGGGAAFGVRRLTARRAELLLVLVVFPLLHVAYGLGTLHGLVRFRGGSRAYPASPGERRAA